MTDGSPDLVAMAATAEAPGPGWYADPADPHTNRYWDGGKWTDNRAPRGPAPTPGTIESRIGQEKEQSASGVVITGYVFAVLMPLIGFIIGLTQINRSRHGIWVVVTSVVAFFVWLAIIGASAESGTGGGGGNGYLY